MNNYYVYVHSISVLNNYYVYVHSISVLNNYAYVYTLSVYIYYTNICLHNYISSLTHMLITFDRNVGHNNIITRAAAGFTAII